MLPCCCLLLLLWSAVPPGLDWWTFEVIVMLSGLLPNPEQTMSMMGITFNVHALCFFAAHGLSGAASTRVGNDLGAGRPHMAWLTVQVRRRCTAVCANLQERLSLARIGPCQGLPVVKWLSGAASTWVCFDSVAGRGYMARLTVQVRVHHTLICISSIGSVK